MREITKVKYLKNDVTLPKDSVSYPTFFIAKVGR